MLGLTSTPRRQKISPLRAPRPLDSSGLVVQKFGGSSIADADGIKRAAQRILETRAAGNNVVVVLSAMGDTTDDLLDLAATVSPSPAPRDLDFLLTTGECISIALLGMALANLGVPSQLFTGHRAGLKTDDVHGKAHIVDVEPRELRTALARGEIPIVAGFQGTGVGTKEITTLGRGGSDITAIALAAALGAGICEIYTDVDGVYSADPRVVPAARKLEAITSAEMLELAACGAKVLQARCVEYARRFGVLLHVRSSFTHSNGTLVVPDGGRVRSGPGAFTERPVISAVGYENSTASIRVESVPDVPGKAAQVFAALSAVGSAADMVGQSVSAVAGYKDMVLALPATEAAAACQALQAARPRIGFSTLHCDEHMGKLSLTGAGMRLDPEVSYRFFRALTEADIPINLISTSDSTLSVLTRADLLDAAVLAVRRAFGWEPGTAQMTVPVPAPPAVVHLAQ
ncbi:aspartate kinase [Arthrobacter sp. VKM Ac-2550]|uniref:aspartate kinase n=1 Tax=Crystallibacter permensis TaxID=1938888 RepID=UPI0039B5B337